MSKFRQPLDIKNFVTVLCSIGASLCLSALPTSAVAQEPAYPKVIKIVVPFSPGASNDLFARALARRMAPRLGSTIIIENKPGAGGAIGAESVSRAAPDGATLLFMSSAITTSPAVNANLSYDPINGFAPVALVASSSLILVVGADAPWRTVPQLLQALRERDNKMTYGSSGVGSVNNIATELFHSMAGTTALHLPYKGMNEALVDMIGGRVNFMLTTVASTGSLVKSGKVRALAVSSLEASKLNPELPLVKNFVRDYTADVWWGVFAPPQTPKALVDRFNAEIQIATADPELQALFAREGAERSTLSATQFSKLVVDEVAKWKKVASERGIPLQ